MNFKTFKLPPLLIRELYKDCLVDPSGVSLSGVDKIIQNHTLGDYLRKILVVINNPTSEMIEENELIFLTGILNACKLSLRDVAVFNISATAGIKYGTLLNHFKPRTALLFGITPEHIDLPVNFPEFKIQKFSDVQFLYAPSLNGLENDKVQKGKLWACLKQLFL